MPKNMIRQQADNFWFSHHNQIFGAVEILINDGDETPLRNLLNRRFEDGAAWAMHETARLNPYVSQFLEMCILLGGPRETLDNEADSGAPADPPGVSNDDMHDLRESVHVRPPAPWDATYPVR